MGFPTDDAWEGLVGSIFTAPWGDLRLARVDRRSARDFSLLFDGPADGPTDQGTVALDNEQHGALPLFLVTVAATSEHITYQAVFNRAPEGPSTA